MSASLYQFTLLTDVNTPRQREEGIEENENGGACCELKRDGEREKEGGQETREGERWLL